MHMVRYLLSTGQIDGVYESGVPAMLDAQRALEATTYGYLQLDGVLIPQDTERYEVIEQRLVERRVLTIEAAPTPFPADGETECVLTVEPWQSCTLLVNGSPYLLTDDEPFLLLTSDVPQTFDVRLAPLPHCWAAPIRVEARADAEM